MKKEKQSAQQRCGKRA